ncbi:hypothetical protein [Burkholderia cenocepacia]|uniref:hypothetical protein n=1 Tax=Burkholderia cenocepacia TaxID=95486 RepID=UPI002238CF37|nr:hypothetical protein [Burkholderia cenocepacia]MCW5141081.1 hypothetical protein [Burkholderia cenocepacia]
MDLHTFLLNLPRDEREPFGERCGSTFGRLRQIAYGNEPATAELATAIDRETRGAVSYRDVNSAWIAKKGASDTRRRVPMDWDYIERKVRQSIAASLDASQSGVPPPAEPAPEAS